MEDNEKSLESRKQELSNKYGINFEEILTSIIGKEELNRLIGPSPIVLTDDYAPVNLL